VDRSFSERLRLNSAIVKNRYWRLPVDDVGHENYMPVGRGVKSSPVCGKWVGLLVCKNVEGHEGKFLGVTDCTNKVVVRHRHLWCHRSACPVCFIRGWAVRGAGSIKGRLIEGDKRGFGEVEHIVVSVSIADRDLPESVLRKRCRKVLLDCGVTGGCMIFHGYRIDREREVLVWGPHYHVLGYLEGGYSRCRHCTGGDCYACDGLQGEFYKTYWDTGYIVRVMDERETVFGTAWYQLNHSTIRLGVKRFHVVTWFGCCGNRKFKSANVDVENVCPVCESEMVRSVYVGKRRIVKDVGHPDYVPLFVDDEFDDDGEPNYIDVDGG
jgi:hypothetical protein